MLVHVVLDEILDGRLGEEADTSRLDSAIVLIELRVVRLRGLGDVGQVSTVGRFLTLECGELGGFLCGLPGLRLVDLAVLHPLAVVQLVVLDGVEHVLVLKPAGCLHQTVRGG